MKLSELAWVSFIFANLTRHDPTYQALISDGSFLSKLRTKPSLVEFQRVRDFLAHYRVPWAPKDLAQKYLTVWPALKPYIEQLSSESLIACDLESKEIQDAILHAYSYLQWPHVWGGDTVTSKTLHWFNTSFFIMWDENIQTSYRKFGAQGYLEFLKIMQSHAIEALNDFEQLSLPMQLDEVLSSQLGYPTTRPLVKLLDDYNWIIITKGWPPNIPNWLLELFPHA